MFPRLSISEVQASELTTMSRKPPNRLYFELIQIGCSFVASSS
jgi:hypothetical protein